MLGTRTKQVYAYGKRGHRIVNISERSTPETDERNGYSKLATPPKPSKHREHHDTPSSTPPRVKRTQKKVKQISPASSSLSPVAAAKAIRMRQVSRRRKVSPPEKPLQKVYSSPRPPLASVSPYILNSPATSAPRKKKANIAGSRGNPPNAIKPHSPIVTVDIFVMDGAKKVSQETRISRTDVTPNQVKFSPVSVKREPRPTVVPTRKASVIVISDTEDDEPSAVKPSKSARSVKPTQPTPVDIHSDNDDEDEELPQLKKRAGRRAKPVVISSDSEDSLPSPRTLTRTRFYRPHPQPQPQLRASKLIFDEPPYQAPKHQAVFVTPIPHVSRTTHKVTPIRYATASLFPHVTSPPSPTTPSDFDLDDYDLSQELEDLNIAVTPTAAAKLAPPQPVYLRPLLDECCQSTPHEFSAFIESFPFDPVVHPLDTPTGPPISKYEFRKIGEASYSEVFGIGDVVLKIIPLRDEEPQRRLALHISDADTPPPSDAKDVVKEIIVTRAMGDMCEGFVKLLRTYVVRGRYPSLLLDLWDSYNEVKGSESVRPDNFPVSQTYAIIVLPNGGPDLESYTFSQPNKTGWRQACSLFWQVTRALADAEDLVSFEHRDLHWGQILIKNTSVVPQRRLARTKVFMDSPAYGVAATVIDLGLSRMDSGDGQGMQTHWTPFDEEIFEGKGDYQFDVYRMMREHIGKSWTAFRPLTNVMWLHYLSLKLLHSKRLKPPAASRKSSTISDNSFTERDCYECLMEVERLLKGVTSPFQKPASAQKGRGRKAHTSSTQTPQGPKSAGDVRAYAAERGWISSN